jgi:glycosyltransferase involved in cell wall biosynthesis
MKILWLIHGGEVYGEKRAVCSLMEGVRASGWTAEAASLTNGECVEALRDAGIPVTCMEAGDSPGMHRARGKTGRIREAAKLLAHQIHLGPKIRKAIRTSSPDAVHVLDKNILPAVAWAAAREKKPCMWEMTAGLGRGYAFDLNGRLHRLLVRLWGVHPLANSAYTAATLAGAKCKVEVMYLGMDTQVFDPGRTFGVTREALGIPADACVFAIVARVDPSKGQLLFLKAMAEVGDGAMHLLLVGVKPGSEEVAKIEAFAEAHGLKERVHLVGLTTEPEAYIAVADVMVNARVDAEPFGLSTVEGMVMGKPSLVHALGGPAETVIDGENGWHMQEATVEAFAAGIRRALEDRARLGEIGAAGRGRAMKFYTLKAQAERYRALVMKAIAARRP